MTNYLSVDSVLTDEEIVIKHFFLSRLSDIKRVEARHWRIPIPMHFTTLVPNGKDSTGKVTFSSVAINRIQFYKAYLKDNEETVCRALDTKCRLEYDDDFFDAKKIDKNTRYNSYIMIVFEHDGDEVYFNFLYRPINGWRWKTEDMLEEIERERARCIEAKKREIAEEPVRFKGKTQP